MGPLGPASAFLFGGSTFDLACLVVWQASLKGESIPDLVKRRGWPAFRQLELETLLQTLESPHAAAPVRPYAVAPVRPREGTGDGGARRTVCL